MKQIFIILLLTLNIVSCDNGHRPDCSAVLCWAAHYTIELIEETSDENYLVKNNYTAEDLVLKDSDNNGINLQLQNGIIIINRQPPEGNPFTLTINNEIGIIYHLEWSNPKTMECCDFGEIENVEMNISKFEVEGNQIKAYL